MGSRKRGRDEMESSEPATDQSLLDRIRSKWELANLMQYIFIFGKAVKIDEDLAIEVRSHCIYPDDIKSTPDIHTAYEHCMLTKSSKQDLEMECIKPEPSQILSDIGLALLKYISSHRGLK